MFVLDVPKAVLSEATTPKPIALNQYDSVWIDVAAKDIFIKNKDNETWTLNMEKVVIDKLNLTPQKPELENGNPPKTIHVQRLHERSPKNRVMLTLMCRIKQASPFGKARLHIISCQQCNTEKGGKQSVPKKHPSKALLKDVKQVFDKHDWPGASIGIRALSSTSEASECPNGQTLTEVTYQTADGTWVIKKICL